MPAENPSQSSTPVTSSEKHNDSLSKAEIEVEEDISAEKETERVRKQSDVLIKESHIGIINWNLEHSLTHGYYNKRDVDKTEVAVLTKSIQAEDRREQHPLWAAVDKAELEKLNIHPSQDAKTAPALTVEQYEALEIIAIAGQHRQMSGQEILTIAKDKHAASKAELEKLKLHVDEHEVAAEGDQDGVLGAEDPESSMVSAGTPEEAVARGNDSILDVSEKDLGKQSAAATVAALKRRISQQAEEVARVTYWPMILVDKGRT